MRLVRILFNVRGYLDRRGPALQRQADELLERTWRNRVANNPKERARLERQRAQEPVR